MEDIVQFLIIAAFIAISFAGNARKKKREMEQEELPDTYEELEDEEEDEKVKTKAKPMPQMFIPAPKPAVDRHKNKRDKKKQQEAPKAVAPSVPATQQSGSVTDLRSPQKAREAFIHSIIFERKYQ